MDQLPAIFASLLAQLKREIPDVPVSAEPLTAGHSSSSLVVALGDPPSNVTPSAVVRQAHVVARPPEGSAVAQNEVSDVPPEVHITRSRDPAPTPDSRTLAIENAPSVFAQPLSSSGITFMNPPYPATVNQHTTAVPNDAARRHYKPMEYNQLAPVPGRNFSNAIPSAIQGRVLQPQPPGRQKASTSTLRRQSSVKVRLPKEADRSRLAKDILKQLGKPSGSVPAVPTRREYKERKKTGAHMEATSIQPLTKPVVAEPQPLSNHDGPPLSPEIVPVPDQVPPPNLPVNSPPATLTGEPPSLKYPDLDAGSTTRDADATGEDINMDIQPPDDPLLPQSQVFPRSDPPQEPVPSPVNPKSDLDKEKRSATNQPPIPEFPSLKRNGPPPGAEVIEISDDEEQAVDAAINTVEPMEVDEEVGTGGAISQSLSGLSLDGDDTLVAVETEKDRTEELLGRRSQEAIAPEDLRSAGRKLKKNRPCVEVPPLPDYARQKKGKERAQIQEVEEEGLCGMSVLRVWLLTYYSPPRPRTSSCRRPCIFEIATDALPVVGM